MDNSDGGGPLAYQTYIGTKIIEARPFYVDGKPGYKVLYEDGYESWSPQEAFEKAYRPAFLGQMNFGLAIEALKKGNKVSRKGWNGRGMWLVLDPGTESVELRKGSVYEKAGLFGKINIDAHIDMFTAKRTMQPGWLASQADMLADDWFIIY